MGEVGHWRQALRLCGLADLPAGSLPLVPPTCKEPRQLHSPTGIEPCCHTLPTRTDPIHSDCEPKQPPRRFFLPHPFLSTPYPASCQLSGHSNLNTNKCTSRMSEHTMASLDDSRQSRAKAVRNECLATCLISGMWMVKFLYAGPRRQSVP